MTKLKLDLVMKELPKVNNMGHRTYVGGNWDYTGKKQFDFMVKEGLKPNHYFLDIGCGCFRGGRFFINYLEPWHYYGIEQHQWLVDAGMKELGAKTIEEKKIRVLVDDNFSFGLWSEVPPCFDFVLAKSVFTHLTKDKIKQCLDNIKEDLVYNKLWECPPNEDLKFYASIFVGDSKNNPKEDHDNKRFFYSIDEIKELADGWNVESLGHRGCHHQTMLKFAICKK